MAIVDSNRRRRDSMLAITRRSAIKAQLLERKSVTITDLAIRLHVTKETIRRDLRLMEEQGDLIRTHGGAYILDGVQNDIDISMRQVLKTEEKTIIAEKCSQHIQSGDSIFLDDSTTCWFVARQLVHQNLTVLTTSLQIATILAASANIQLIVIGGAFCPNSMSFQGDNACRALSSYYVDKAFMSCRSISMENGVTDISESAAAIHRLVTRRSNRTYLVLDHSKVGPTSFAFVCEITDVDAVICDRPLPQPWQDYLKERNVPFY